MYYALWNGIVQICESHAPMHTPPRLAQNAASSRPHLVLRPWPWLAACAVGLAASLSALAASAPAGTLDRSFDPSANGQITPFAGGQAAVHSIAVQPDGCILAGGRFELVNSEPRGNLVRLDPDGRVGPFFSPGPGTDGEVLAVVAQADGCVLVGGRFLSVRGQTRQGIARLTPAGDLDPTFEPSTGANGAVARLALHADGRILLAGSFTEVNGRPCRNLARLRPDGTLDPGFAAPWLAGLVSVRGIRVLGNDRMLVAGGFAGGIVRLEPDGTLDPGFQAGVTHGSATPEVFAFDLDPEGRIWIAGHFSEVDGESHRGVARLLPDGQLDVTFRLREQLDALPNTVLAQAEGKVLVGGWFSRVGGVERRAVARFLADGSLDPTFDAVSAFGFYGQPNVDSLAALADGRVLLGIERADSSYNPGRVITCLKADGRLDSSFTASFEHSAVDLRALALQADGRVYIGGDFRLREGDGIRNAARLLADGTPDLSFQPNIGGSVRALVALPDGKCLVGGTGFAGSVGQPYPLVRLLWDGRLDPAFQRNAALPEVIRSIVLQPDGKIVIGGGSYGVNARCLARLDPDGTVDSSFIPPAFPAGDEITVNALALAADGGILVGGELGFESSPLPRTIARLNPSGSLDESFRGAECLGAGVVLALAVQSDGCVLVGGQLFVGDQGQIAGLVRLTPDGALDTSFQPPAPAEPVQSLARQPDGRILIGTTSAGLHRLLADGQRDTGFVNALAYPNGNAGVAVVLIQADGQVLVTGSFGNVGGVPRKGIARLNNDPAPDHPDICWTVESGPGTALGFSPDGTRLATTSAGVRLWDVRSGTLVRTISGAFGGLGSVDFAPDNWRLAAGDGDGQIYVWNVWDGSRVWSWKTAGDVTSVRFTAAGDLASWSSDQTTVRFWQTDDGSPLATLDGLEWSHHNVAFSPDGTLAALGGDDPNCLVQLRRTADGQVERTLAGHAGRVRTVEFSPDGSCLVSGSDDTTIRIWRVADGATLRVLSGHTQGVWKIALAPNGVLASTSDDGTLRLWCLADGTLLQAYTVAGVGGRDVEFSPDGSLLAYSAGDRVIVARSPAPAITTPPLSQTRFTGQTAEFQVAATGLTPLCFQWCRDGVVLDQAADPVLKIPLLSPADAGRYSVTVSNRLGAVASQDAILTVLPKEPGGDLIDFTFDPTAGGALAGPAGGRASIQDLALQPDGKLIVVGDFAAFNGVPRRCLARLNPDHSLDESFHPGLGPNRTVQAVALHRAGTILIGGTFTTVDGQPHAGLARLRPDGSVDPTFQTDTTGANVGFLDVEADGGIWVGGNFDRIAGVQCPNLARLRADGSPDPSFAPAAITGGPYDYVNWLHRLPNGMILVGGHFESQRPLGGQDQTLVRLGADGSLDPSFNCELSGMFLSDAAVRPNGSILAAGMLHSWTGGSHYFVLADLDSQGRVTREYAPADLPALVTSILRPRDGRTYIGGMFTTACQTPRPGLARLNADGSFDPTFDPGYAFPASFEPAVLCLALQADGRLWVGAEQSGSPEATHALTLLAPDGQPEAEFAPRLSGNAGTVSALALDTNGRLLVAGAFTTFNRQPRIHLARLHPDGTLDESFVPALNPNLWVRVLLPQPDGRILVAGKADAAATPPLTGLVRLNSDGSVDPTLVVTPSAEGTCGYVRCLDVQPDGKIIVGGEFDLPPRGLARLNPDGTVDPTFRPPPLPAWDEEGVHTVAVLADGRILIGGPLSGVEGAPPAAMARLNPDGSVDTTFDLGVAIPGGPTRFVPTGDGGWWVGGVPSDTSGPIHQRLLRLTAEGALDRILDVPVADPFQILAVEATGHILVSGTAVRRLNPDGSLAGTFRAQPSWAGAVNAAVVQADGRIVLGGDFSSINGVPAHNLARLNPATPRRQPFVERQVASGFQVRLLAHPRSGTSRYSVEDVPSWKPVRNVSDAGRYDVLTGKVVFGPFNDDKPRTLSYSIVIPPGAAGVIRFEGAATADGVDTAIVGDNSLRVWEFPPPPCWIELRRRPLSQGWIVQVWGQSSLVYALEASSDLSRWQELGTVSCAGGLGELTVAPLASTAQFFRARTAAFQAPH